MSQHLSEDFFKELGLMPLRQRQAMGLHKQVERPKVAEPEEKDLEISLPVEEEQTSVEAMISVIDLLVLAPNVEAWQADDMALENQLWQAIQQAFHWQNLKIKYLDLQLYQTQAACSDLMDSVMESGVDQVLIWGQAEVLAPMLSEGVTVIALPELAELVQQSNLKKAVYQKLLPLAVI